MVDQLTYGPVVNINYNTSISVDVCLLQRIVQYTL